MPAVRRYAAFGLAIDTNLALDGLSGAAAHSGRELSLRISSPAEVIRDFEPLPADRHSWETVIDEERYCVAEGEDGSLVFEWADAQFRLTADSGELLCAPAQVSDHAWRRVLLDTVLATVSLRHGFEALHAGAVERQEGLLVVAAGSGGGKTSLIAELVSRGSPLFCDDVLVLRDGPGGPVGFPAPAVMNLPLSAATQPAELGRVIATFGGERWIAVANSATAAASPAAIVVLQRGALDRGMRLDPLGSPHLALLTAALRSGIDPQRMAARFRVCGDLATRVPTYSLRSDLATPASALADLIERTPLRPAPGVVV